MKHWCLMMIATVLSGAVPLLAEVAPPAKEYHVRVLTPAEKHADLLYVLDEGQFFE